jgi:hypothetical protein
MPLPELNEEGFLPSGIYDCTLEELKQRFGSFQVSNRRPELFLRLAEYISEAKLGGLLHALIIDGSFVTAEASPNDVDMIAVLKPDHDFSAELRPYQANVLSNRHVRRRYGFDVLVAREGSEEYTEYTAFFQQVRGKPELNKGILRILL